MEYKFFLFFAFEHLHHFPALSLLLLLFLKPLLVQTDSDVKLIGLVRYVFGRAQVLLLPHHFLLQHLLFKLFGLVNPGFFEILLVESQMDGLMGLGGLRASLQGKFF
jgi:hypothetical protein